MAQGIIRYVPNTLSLGRIVLAGLFPFTPQWLWLWFILISGFSDFLDGWIARKWKVQSWQGSLLDGIADKLFILFVLITFAGTGKFSWWWIPLLLARDLLVTFVAVYTACIKSWASFKKMESRWPGKIATFAMFFLFLVVLLLPAGTLPALVVAALFSVAACVDYGYLFIKELRILAANKKSTDN